MINKIRISFDAKKFLCLVIICFCVISSSFSAELNFDTLINNLQNAYVKPLARDIGSALGGDMFRSGRTLPTLPGIDVGVAMSSVMKPLDDDVILKSAMGDKVFGLPYIQLSKGLPYGLDITVRGFPQYQNVKLLGGGVKYQVIDKGFAAIKLGLSAMYSINVLQHTDFTATTNSLAGILSLKLPMVEPYIGVGFDSTNIKTFFSVAEFGNLPVTPNVNTTVSEPRYVFGLNFSLIPFTFINVAATSTVNRLGLDLGLGLSF